MYLTEHTQNQWLGQWEGSILPPTKAEVERIFRGIKCHRSPTDHITEHTAM